MGKVNKASELLVLFMIVRDTWAVWGTWEHQEHLLKTDTEHKPRKTHHDQGVFTLRM